MRTIARYPTGMVVWGPIPDAPSLSLVWTGPGSRLYLGVKVMDVGGSMVPIEHPAADSSYETEKETKAAAARFLAAAS